MVRVSSACLCGYFVTTFPTFSIDALMAAARQEGVEFNFEGSIHLADDPFPPPRLNDRCLFS
jgi:hypothetical protein